MNVYFRDSHGEKRLLKKNVTTKEEAWRIMQDFMREHDFQSYYTRVWYEDGYTWHDVGSHTEFFLVDENLMGEYENEQEEEKAVFNTAQRNKQSLGYRPE